MSRMKYGKCDERRGENGNFPKSERANPLLPIASVQPSMFSRARTASTFRRAFSSNASIKSAAFAGKGAALGFAVGAGGLAVGALVLPPILAEALEDPQTSISKVAKYIKPTPSGDKNDLETFTWGSNK